MTFRSLLNALCDIEQATPATDAASGQPQSLWQTVRAAVPCRLRWRSQEERSAGPSEYRETDYTAYLCAPAPTEDTQRLRAGSRLFRIAGVQNMGAAGKYFAVYLKELPDGY